MTTATVAPSKAGKPAKFRRDHRINWWLTAAVAVLSLTILIPLYFTIVTALYVFSSQFATNYPMAFSSYLMAMAPILIVYIFAQKWVVGGVMRGAVK